MKRLKSFFSKLKSFFKDLWDWLSKLFPFRRTKEIEKAEEETEEEREIPSDPPEEPKEVPCDPPELIENAFSKRGKNGFITVYSTERFNEVIHEHFHSIDELISCLNGRRNNSAMLYKYSSSSGNPDFTGTSNYTSAIKLLRNGYSDILPEIESGIDKNINKFKELFINNKSKPISSVYGFAPNVPNHLMGLPDSMNDRFRDSHRVKTIDILYCPQGPWNVGRETFIKGGIAVLSAIQLIESSGISISLNCSVYSGYDGSDAVIGTVNLKEYKDRLDLKKICFPIAHPSMLRRIGFKFLETVPNLTNTAFSSGYGKSPSHEESKDIVKVGSNVVILTLELVRNKFHFDVKQIAKYIKDNARR